MDIIFLLIIAGWILFRLFSILGQDLGGNTEAFKDSGIVTPETAKASVKTSEDVIDVTAVKNDTVKSPFISDSLQKKIAKVDSSFDANDFVVGANSCFSTIIKSFAEDDKDTLKKLLTTDTYEVFSNAIDERIENGHDYVEEVLTFISTKIIKINVEGSVLDISVKFTTDQINVVYDNADRVIQGHPNDIVRLDDTWVFTRDMASKSQNWYLKETQ